jgi:protein TonB
MPRLIAVVASVLIHVGLVATAMRVGLPAADFSADVIAAELMAAEPVAPPPRKAEPPAPAVVAPKPKPVPPQTLPKLIDAPAPKIEERRVEETPPAPPPDVVAKRVEDTAPPSSTSPGRASEAPASPLPAGMSAITSEPPPATTRPSAPTTSAPATPGPSAAVAPDAITRTAIPRGGYQVRPSYPSSARRLGAEGTTMLRVHVTAEGRVEDVVVETSAGHRDLDQAAVEAVRRWRFEPARSGSDAVAMWVRLPVEFRLR